ncbi:MAG: alpha/beta hydrolase [Solirubrobacterales bacterium]
MLPRDDLGSGPPVVLLHAGIADRTMWAEHLGPIAAAGRRAIAFDLPGFGEAPPTSAPEWEAVLEAMDGLSLDRAAIVGNSFGGAVAMRIAAIAPERVESLALISAPPPALQPSARLAAAWDAEEKALERGDIDAAVEAVLEAWLQPGAPAELRDRVARMQRRALELQIGAPAEEPPDPLQERPELLEKLGMPILVAVGEQDLGDFRSGAEQLAGAMPGARLEPIPDAGHLAPLEAPEGFRELLLEFLAQSPGRKGAPGPK